MDQSFKDSARNSSNRSANPAASCQHNKQNQDMASRNSQEPKMDSKVLREQSRAHLNKLAEKKQQQAQQQAQEQANLQMPYAGAAYMPGYYIPGPMGMMPFMMNHPMSYPPVYPMNPAMQNAMQNPMMPMQLPEHTTPSQHSQVDSDINSQPSPLAASLPVGQFQPPMNPAAMMTAPMSAPMMSTPMMPGFNPYASNPYASMPYPVFAYPHQMPLVPMQAVPIPGMYPQQQVSDPAQQSVKSDGIMQHVNPVPMLAGALKRKIFGLTYPPVGNDTPKPKMLSIDTWKAIRQAQKVLKHNWHQEMKLRDKPSISERKADPKTLDDLFPGTENKTDHQPSKANSSKQTPSYKKPYREHIVFEPDAKIQREARPVFSPSSVVNKVVSDSPVTQNALQAHLENTTKENSEQLKTNPASEANIASQNSALVSEEVIVAQEIIETIASQEPALQETIAQDDIVEDPASDQNNTEVIGSAFTSQELLTEVETYTVSSDILESNIPEFSTPESNIPELNIPETNIMDGLNDIFTAEQHTDFTDIENSPEHKAYATVKNKNAKPKKRSDKIVPVELSRRNIELESEIAEVPLEMPSRPSLWSRAKSVFQKASDYSEILNQQAKADLAKSLEVKTDSSAETSHSQTIEQSMLNQAGCVLTSDGDILTGANTYDMWCEYKSVENKMHQQKKMIHDLLAVKQQFNDKKLNSCYLPDYADESKLPGDTRAEMAQDLALSSLKEAMEAVNKRHPVQKQPAKLPAQKPEIQNQVSILGETPSIENQAIAEQSDVKQPELKEAEAKQQVEALKNEPVDNVQVDKIQIEQVARNTISSEPASPSVAVVAEVISPQARPDVYFMKPALGKEALDSAVRQALSMTQPYPYASSAIPVPQPVTSQNMITNALYQHIQGMRHQPYSSPAMASFVQTEATPVHHSVTVSAVAEPVVQPIPQPVAQNDTVYSVETTVRFEMKRSVSQAEDTSEQSLPEDFMLQSMLQNSKSISKRISCLAEEYFRQAEE